MSFCTIVPTPTRHGHIEPSSTYERIIGQMTSAESTKGIAWTAAESWPALPSHRNLVHQEQRREQPSGHAGNTPNGGKCILEEVLKTKFQTLKLQNDTRTAFTPWQGNRCPFCWEDYQQNDTVVISRCGHYLHRKCFNEELAVSLDFVCAQCRCPSLNAWMTRAVQIEAQLHAEIFGDVESSFDEQELCPTNITRTEVSSTEGRPKQTDDNGSQILQGHEPSMYRAAQSLVQTWYRDPDASDASDELNDIEIDAMTANIIVAAHISLSLVLQLATEAQNWAHSAWLMELASRFWDGIMTFVSGSQEHIHRRADWMSARCRWFAITAANPCGDRPPKPTFKGSKAWRGLVKLNLYPSCPDATLSSKAQHKVDHFCALIQAAKDRNEEASWSDW